MLPRPAIGIEAIAAAFPNQYIDLGTLAEANNVDPGKYYVGLGVNRMAVPAPHEDSVTLAAGAAFQLIHNNNVDINDIGTLIVGTETSVDAAKPIAVYLHGLLGLSPSCRTFDTKHACYGGTAALKLVADWVAARSGSGKKALVVTTDIARYEVESPGEPTQGAGAVAMLVAENPSLLTFDDFPEAVYTQNVMDFWRPHYLNTAVVLGHTSIECYLEALEQTYSQYQELSGLKWDDYRHLLFHVPFPKMAYKGFKLLYDLEAKHRNGNPFPSFEEAFAHSAEPALWANRQVGNIYSGSLYLALASLLERRGPEVAGTRIGLFSYGSGSCAEFFSGRIGPDASAWAGKIGVGEALNNRRELNYEQYLQFREEADLLNQEDSYLNGSGFKPADDRALSFHGIRHHERVYKPGGLVKHLEASHPATKEEERPGLDKRFDDLRP